jgi:hypothetical protein
MSTRSWEFVTADEPTVIAEACLDAIVVEDGECDGCFPDSPCTDESNGFEILGVIDDLLDQPVASETGPGRWGRQLSRWDAM